MAQISRVKDPEIENGNVIDADDLDAEFDALVLESNDQDDRLTALEEGDISVTGDKTFPGVITFSNATSPIKTDKIVERTSANGVAVDGLTIKDGIPLGWEKFRGSAAPVYASASTFTVAHIHEVDSGLAGIIRKTTSTTVDITTSGLNGLDTGAEASGTWYFLYAIAKAAGADPGLILSVTNESSSGSITLPTDYVLKRQLPFAVRNDGSSNFLKWYVADGWPYRPRIMYDETNTFDTGATLLVTGSVVTSWTDTDASALVPPISTVGIIYVHIQYSSNTGVLSTRPNGSSHSGTRRIGVNSTGTIHEGIFNQLLDSSQVYERIHSSNGSPTSHHCIGFVVNGVN